MDRRRFFALASAASLTFPGTARAAGAPLKLRMLYARGGGSSELAQSLADKRVSVSGFMAPPLKAESNFFVLTKMPMSVCPFCETSAEWPDDIIAVYTKRIVQVIPFNVKIETSGILELGEYRDPDTGFVSLARLADATYK